ncbi:uncharacterized protein LOC132256880 [Phlebotomus argentipes]|uniref:uncharacterized protein LOC132256880 n=1 Tax=Phlebotomus argentipes TaxID=94469 RepID=UPI002892AF62|nr:uncharacterized protein LOC132256880 [Phlebotomus argentipes]
MDGVLFLIIIPTEKEEENLSEKKVSFFSKDSFTPEDHKNTKKSENAAKGHTEAEDNATESSPTDKLLNKHEKATIIPAQNRNERLREVVLQKASQEATKDTHELNIPPESSMERVLEEIIARGKISGAAWTEVRKSQKWQIIFTLENGHRCDRVTQWLSEWGIGYREGSTITLTPCTVHDFAADAASRTASQTDLEHKEGIWERFVASVTARLNVAQLVDQVRVNAEIRFDFVTLIVVAALLAGFGLVENNSLFLAASMLISPLMGPIVAATFGTVIKDRNLTKLGVTNELLGILLSILVGFSFGLIVCIFDGYYGLQKGLTPEMLSRCELHSLVVGILIALPSGAAVAIGILGENAGSLAGVAISASLLPPAVNSGFLWAVAAFYNLFGQESDTRFRDLVKTSQYSSHQFTELILQATVSLGVTLTNVISIYLMGVFILRIKEVAPMVTKTHTHFWKHDVKIARDYNKTCQFDDAESLRQNLEREIDGFEAHSENHGSDVRAEIRRRMSRGALMPLSTGNQNTWGALVQPPSTRPTIQDIEALYRDNIYPKLPERVRSSFLIPDTRDGAPFFRRSSMPAASIRTKSTKPKLGRITEMNNQHDEPQTPRGTKKTFTVLSVENEENGAK